MRLRVLRAERGLSLTEAAERAGIQRQTLALLERGERHPHDPTLAKIAKGYGVPVEELLEEPVPLAEAPREAGRLQDERRLYYLRLFRAFLHTFSRRWEEEPPKTFEETVPFSKALIDVLKQGGFEPPQEAGPKELYELERFEDAIDRLIEIAAKAKGEERAGEQEAGRLEDKRLEADFSEKTQAPPPDVPADGAETDEEQHLRYLRGWGDFIDRLAQRWEAKPPQASKEIDPALGALAPLLDQRVFDLSGREGPSEAEELMRIRRGIERLAKIIQKVEEVEQGSAADNIESMAEYRERMKRSA
jgi:transcriptional regulator with XRE-family HTH domain